MIFSNILLKTYWGQLCDFPFRADVWGTVSDWVMVVITLTGTIALLWTLTDQIKINKQTIQKSIREIRPYFKIKFVKPTDKSSQGTYELYLENAAAFRVSLVYIGDEPPENGYIALWETHNQPIKMDNPYGKTKDERLICTVYFEDEERRKIHSKNSRTRG